MKIDWSFVKGSAVVGVGNVVARVLGLVFFIIVARIYVPSEYGYVRYVITIALLACTVVSAGFPVAITRYLGKYRENKRLRDTYFSNGITAVLLLLLCITMILFVIGKLDLGTVIVMVGIIIFQVYFAVLRGFIFYKKIACLQISTSILKIGLIAFFFYLTGYCQPLIVLAIFSFSCVIPIIMMEIFAPLNIKFKRSFISKDVLKEMSIFAVPIVIGSVAYAIINSADIICIGYFLGMKSVGLYSVVKTLTVIFTFVPMAITTILMPKVAGFKKRTKIKYYLRLSLSIVIITSIMLMIFIYSFGYNLIEIIFTSKYLAAASVLFIYSIGMALYSVYTIISNTWIGIGKPAIPMSILFSSAIFNIAGNIYTVPRWGIYGAGIVFALTYLIALGSIVSVTLVKHKEIFGGKRNEIKK